MSYTDFRSLFTNHDATPDSANCKLRLNWDVRSSRCFKTTQRFFYRRSRWESSRVSLPLSFLITVDIAERNKKEKKRKKNKKNKKQKKPNTLQA